MSASATDASFQLPTVTIDELLTIRFPTEHFLRRKLESTKFNSNWRHVGKFVQDHNAVVTELVITPGVLEAISRGHCVESLDFDGERITITTEDPQSEEKDDFSELVRRAERYCGVLASEHELFGNIKEFHDKITEKDEQTIAKKCFSTAFYQENRLFSFYYSSIGGADNSLARNGEPLVSIEFKPHRYLHNRTSNKNLPALLHRYLRGEGMDSAAENAVRLCHQTCDQMKKGKCVALCMSSQCGFVMLDLKIGGQRMLAVSNLIIFDRDELLKVGKLEVGNKRSRVEKRTSYFLAVAVLAVMLSDHIVKQINTEPEPTAETQSEGGNAMDEDEPDDDFFGGDGDDGDGDDGNGGSGGGEGAVSHSGNTSFPSGLIRHAHIGEEFDFFDLSSNRRFTLSVIQNDHYGEDDGEHLGMVVQDADLQEWYLKSRPSVLHEVKMLIFLKECGFQHIPEFLVAINDVYGELCLMTKIDGIACDNFVEKPSMSKEDIVGKVKTAVARLQTKSILHNDIEARNIVVRPDGTVYLIDFEHAHQVSGNHDLDFAREMSLAAGIFM